MVGAANGGAWSGAPGAASGGRGPCPLTKLALLLLCVSGCLHVDPLALLSLPTASAVHLKSAGTPAAAPFPDGLPQAMPPGAGNPLVPHEGAVPTARLPSGSVSPSSSELEANFNLTEGSFAIDDNATEYRLSGPGTKNLTMADLVDLGSNSSFTLPGQAPQSFQAGNETFASAPAPAPEIATGGLTGSGLSPEDIAKLTSVLERQMPHLLPGDDDPGNNGTSDGAIVQSGDGTPVAKLASRCRGALARMFKNSSDCSAEDVVPACTSKVVTIYEWKLLCLSGLYASKADALFTPATPGSVKVQWGTATYLDLLGKITGQLNTTTENQDQTAVYEKVKATATLGPVLQAVAKRILKSKNDQSGGVLLSWTLELSEIPSPLPKDQMARLVLGGVALEKAKREVSFDSATGEPTSEDGTAGAGATPPSAGSNVSSPDTRRSTQEVMGRKYIMLPFTAEATRGTAYSRDFVMVPSTPLWYEGSLPPVVTTASQEAASSKYTCDSSQISEALSVAGSGSFNGVSMQVSASASYVSERMDARSACVAIMTKRIRETGIELTGLELSVLPKLNPEATAWLVRLGGEYFERRYGAFFVLTTLKTAHFDGWCSAFSTQSTEKLGVAAELKGNYGPFSAEMKAKWDSARSSNKFSFACDSRQTGSCNIGGSLSITQVGDCARTVDDRVAKDEGDKVVLMRYADLPDYINKKRPDDSWSVSDVNNGFSLLDNLLKENLQKTWARAMYLSKTTARQLAGWEQTVVLTDLQRIMDVITALARKGPIVESSSATFYDNQNGQAQVAQVNQPRGVVELLPPQFPDDAISSVSVGPGMIVELLEHRDGGGKSVMLGASIGYLGALVLPLDDAVSRIRVEPTQTMSSARMAQILSAVTADLYRIEVRTSYIGSCYGRSTLRQVFWSTEYLDRHDVTCPDGEVLQQFQLRRQNDIEWRYDYTCCKLATLARNAYKRVTDLTPSNEMWSRDYRVLDRHDIQCDGGKGGMLSGFQLVNQYVPDRFWWRCASWDVSRNQQHDDFCRNDFGSTGDNGATCGYWYHQQDRAAFQQDCRDRFGPAFQDKGLCRYSSNCCRFARTCTVPVNPWPVAAAADVCYYRRTPSSDTNGVVTDLDRHNVQCNWDEVLTQVRIGNEWPSRVRIDYTCCAMTR